MHDGDPVGDRQGLVLVVGDEQGGDADLELDAPDLVAQLGADLGVQRRERLVEQEDLRLDRERPGERHPLLLAARELVRVAAGLVAEADQLEEPVGGRRRSVAADPAQPQAEGDVLARGHVREQAVGLKHHAHVAPVRRHVGDVVAVEQDPAGVEPLQAGKRAQGRGLAAARGAEQGDELAGADLERQAVQRADLAEAAAQIDQPDLDPRRRDRRSADRAAGGSASSSSIGRLPARPGGRRTTAGRAGRRRGSRAASETATATPASRLPRRLITTCSVSKVKSEEMVNSPRTSATEISDAEMQGAADVGHDDPPDDAGPGAAQAASRLGQRDEVDGRRARRDRAVGEGQDQDDVDEGQRERRFAQEVGDPAIDRRQADHEHDRRDGQRQEADELDQPAQPRQPQLDPDHGRHEQDEHEERR